MGEIIDFKDFYKAKIEEQNKLGHKDLEHEDFEFKTKVVSLADEKAKQESDLFIGDEFDEPTARLHSVMDNDKMNSILLRLFQLDDNVHENAYLAQLLEAGKIKQSNELVQKIAKQYYADKQTDTICDYIEIANNLSAYVTDGLTALQNLSDKVYSLFKFTYGMYLEDIASIPEFNETAEKMYLQLTTSSDFNEIFDAVVFDAIMGLSQPYNSARDDVKYLKENIELFHQKLTSEFYNTNPSIYDTMVVYSKILNRKMDDLQKTSRILLTLLEENEDPVKNEHYNIVFERKEIEDMKKLFDNADKAYYKDLKKFDSRLFSKNLNFALERLNNTNQKEIIVDSQEVESQLLYKIITTAPHQLKPFVNYFEKTGLTLPLPMDRIQFYLPDLATVISDNKRLNKIFCVEHSESKLDASPYRAKSAEVENIKQHAKNKKTKQKVVSSNQKQARDKDPHKTR